MNRRLVLSLTGKLIVYESLSMIVPLVVSLMYGGEDMMPFIYSIIITAFSGFFLSLIKPTDNKFRSREGCAAVALTWLAYSFFGALPFYFSGYFSGFEDCLFESVSGFTTTGATILLDVEALPRGILFWRSFTHWIGGMGVLVFAIAIMPSIGGSIINLMRAESSATTHRIVPKIKQTARILYSIYISLTLLEILLLIGVGMPVFDAFANAFSSAGTGGFAIHNSSIRYYDSAIIEYIIGIFVILFGINFSLYFYLLKRNFKLALKDNELLTYVAFIAVFVFIITVNIQGVFGSLDQAFRDSFFQVASIITSTGFSTVNFDLWPVLSKMVLIILMLTGSCAGSTSGGLKMMRIIILFKSIKAEINKIIHPRAVNPVKVNGKVIEGEATHRVFMFFFLYFLVIITASLIISIDNYDMTTTVSSVISTIGNTGIGLSKVGPSGSFSLFSPLSKLVLCFCMLAGRLELYPLLVLLRPSLWRKSTVG